MLRRPNNRQTVYLPLKLSAWLSLFGVMITLVVGCTQLHPWASDCDSDCDGCRERYHLDKRSPTMRTFAKAVTHLEEDIEHYGSIVVKAPDIYGQTNLMAYIQEYEREMKNKLGTYAETVQAYIARSDASDLQSITSLGFGEQKTVTGGVATTSVPIPFAQKTDGSATFPGVIDPSTSTATLPNQATADIGALDMLRKLFPSGLPQKAAGGVALEPTENARQNSAFIKVNQGLRRLNMGDDNSRQAGNALYLLRVPVSVLPGRKTHEGYAAKVTMQAQLVIDDNHLKDTFPRLVVGEIVKQLAVQVKESWNDRLLKIDKTTGMYDNNVDKKMMPTNYLRSTTVRAPAQSKIGIMKNSAQAFLGALLEQDLDAIRRRVMEDLIPKKDFAKIIKELEKASNPASDRPVPQEQEIADVLFAIFNDTHLKWEHKDEKNDNEYNTHAKVIGEIAEVLIMKNADDLVRQNKLNSIRAAFQNRMSDPRDWMLAVQTALLNYEINRVLERLPCWSMGKVNLFNPDYEPSAKLAWSEFIKREFPVHVFTIDPPMEEQNVYDAFSRRRELQLSFAFAVANGKMRGDQAMKYSRLMALDQSTIALNRTVVAFMHDNDTFGFIFKPRVQSPPEESSNIEAIARTLWSTGPTRKYDLRHRQLEPGIRECEVLVVMPGFVPQLRLDVTTNWERLTKPGSEKMDYDDMIDLGARVQEVKKFACSVQNQQCYRDGDYQRLVNRVDQLEKMLPLQTQNVRVPYEYDLPGGELFDTGNKHLRPVVTGFYGLHLVSKVDEAEVFITGNNFHPAQTHVIMAGKESHTPSDTYDVEVINRQLLKVKIKSISINLTRKPAELRVATPSGVSNSLTIDFKDLPDPLVGFSFNNSSPLRIFYDISVIKDKDGKDTSLFRIDLNSITNSPPNLVLRGMTMPTKPVKVQFLLANDSAPTSATSKTTYEMEYDPKLDTFVFKGATAIGDLSKSLLTDALTKDATDATNGKGLDKSAYFGYKAFSTARVIISYEDAAGVQKSITAANNMDVFIYRNK